MMRAIDRFCSTKIFLSFKLYLAAFFLAILCITVVTSSKTCGPSTKTDPASGECVSITNYDVLRAVNWLTAPPKTSCTKISTVQDIAVCEDNLPQKCVIWSMISSNWCDHYGSLAFEKYWSEKGCSVTLFHYVAFFKGNKCSTPEGPLEGFPNLNIVREDMWGKKCFNCFYRLAKTHLAQLAASSDGQHRVSQKMPLVDVLKVQSREGVLEDLDGVQYSVLSDLYLHLPEITDSVGQFVYTASINTRSLTDFVGRESEHAWNMWGTQQLLREFGAFDTVPELGPQRIQPLQFTHMLTQAKVDPSFSFYRQSLSRLPGGAAIEREAKLFEQWQPAPAPYELRGVVPSYCKAAPSAAEEQAMQAWIKGELNARCHPTRLWVPCDRNRGYDAIVPCPQELMSYLAEDYAATKGWCDFKEPSAGIEPLCNADAGAYEAFKQSHVHARQQLPNEPKVRLAFFFTVYADAKFVARLLQRLYSPHHYYLLHIDPTGSSPEFEEELRALAASYAVKNVGGGGGIKRDSDGLSNVFISKCVPIVYGASTATIVLTRAMAWFDKHASGWDYFVPLTGADYPLVPLSRIERIFEYQFRHGAAGAMPFVMAWTPGTSTHIFRLQKTHPVFETDPLIVQSIKAVTDERGKVLGAVPMEYRSNNFGPPLFCYNRTSFVHLDNRQNKSARIMDTQWLFPKDTFPGRGRAYAEENPAFATPSFDGGWRIWKKSDPATTGAYDRLSVEYIVNSEEGKKYWNFFKHMLLGSEEHYYVSLLYNWPRTKKFVQSLSAEIVWNTWELGLWEQSGGFQTHTHFLSLNEWSILEGFSKRGMLFGRKFSSTKTAALLDRIDQQFLLNDSASNEAGLFWPGYFEVDTTTPGKQWVAAYRRNQSAKAKARQQIKQQQRLRMAANQLQQNSSRTQFVMRRR